MFETFRREGQGAQGCGLEHREAVREGGPHGARRRGRAEPVAVISRAGRTALDLALGVGGYPRGRIVEIYGPESSGKTTLTLHAIAEAQRAGGIAAFIDAEHALDVAVRRALGVDTEKLLVSQPDTGEQALEIAEALVRSGAVDLVVIDSVAALTPKAEIEGEMGDSHMGLQARLMSQALRKLTGITHRTQTTLIFINQLRQKIGVVFGSPETTTGGNALKFYSSIRLDVRRIATIKSGEEKLGARTRVKVVKNKCAPPFTEAEFDIRWGAGIDTASELLDLPPTARVGRAGLAPSRVGPPRALDRHRTAERAEEARDPERGRHEQQHLPAAQQPPRHLAAGLALPDRDGGVDQERNQQHRGGHRERVEVQRAVHVAAEQRQHRAGRAAAGAGEVEEDPGGADRERRREHRGHHDHKNGRAPYVPLGRGRGADLGHD